MGNEASYGITVTGTDFTAAPTETMVGNYPDNKILSYYSVCPIYETCDTNSPVQFLEESLDIMIHSNACKSVNFSGGVAMLDSFLGGPGMDL